MPTKHKYDINNPPDRLVTGSDWDDIHLTVNNTISQAGNPISSEKNVPQQTYFSGDIWTNTTSNELFLCLVTSITPNLTNPTNYDISYNWVPFSIVSTYPNPTNPLQNVFVPLNTLKQGTNITLSTDDNGVCTIGSNLVATDTKPTPDVSGPINSMTAGPNVTFGIADKNLTIDSITSVNGTAGIKGFTFNSDVFDSTVTAPNATINSAKIGTIINDNSPVFLGNLVQGQNITFSQDKANNKLTINAATGTGVKLNNTGNYYSSIKSSTTDSVKISVDNTIPDVPQLQFATNLTDSNNNNFTSVVGSNGVTAVASNNVLTITGPTIPPIPPQITSIAINYTNTNTGFTNTTVDTSAGGAVTLSIGGAPQLKFGNQYFNTIAIGGSLNANTTTPNTLTINAPTISSLSNIDIITSGSGGTATTQIGSFISTQAVPANLSPIVNTSKFTSISAGNGILLQQSRDADINGYSNLNISVPVTAPSYYQGYFSSFFFPNNILAGYYFPDYLQANQTISLLTVSDVVNTATAGVLQFVSDITSIVYFLRGSTKTKVFYNASAQDLYLQVSVDYSLDGNTTDYVEAMRIFDTLINPVIVDTSALSVSLSTGIRTSTNTIIKLPASTTSNTYNGFVFFINTASFTVTSGINFKTSSRITILQL